MICMPVLNLRGAVAGVIQVARTLDHHESKGNKGWPKPFSSRAKVLIDLFASLVSGHLEVVSSRVEQDPKASEVVLQGSEPTQAIDPVPKLCKGAQEGLTTVVGNLAAAVRNQCEADDVLVHLLEPRAMCWHTYHKGQIFVTQTSVGLAWKAVTSQDCAVRVRFQSVRTLDSSLYTHLNLTPAQVMCCALRHDNGKAFGVLELIRTPLPGSLHFPDRERAAFTVKEELQVARLAATAAASLDAAWRASQLASVAEYQRKNLSFGLRCAQNRSLESLVQTLSKEVRQPWEQ